MKLKCDICGGYFYSELGDAHDIGEINICSEQCMWKVSNNGEPMPPKFDRKHRHMNAYDATTEVWSVDERFEEIIRYIQELVEFYCIKENK